MTDTGVYREPHEPCAVCQERETQAKQMLPFVKSGERICPECFGSNLGFFAVVCRGAGQKFTLQRGFWLFRWWRRREFSCERKNPPKHFHLRCNSCNHRWTMLTASEGT
ncbi:MAG: hypothetical protein AMXMBFR56_62040 [Polyangiaceae bacterium]